MNTVKIWDNGISGRTLDEIVRAVRSGAVMVWPTDSLYGMACDALNPKAIERVCRLKGLNPDKNTLSVICSDISQAAEYARIEDEAFRLMKERTPGPYTFILRAASGLPRAFKGAQDSWNTDSRQGDMQGSGRVLGNPLLNTSIDYEDEDYAVSPGLVAEIYDGRADIFIDGGEGGTTPSTVIDCTSPDFPIVRVGLQADL